MDRLLLVGALGILFSVVGCGSDVSTQGGGGQGAGGDAPGAGGAGGAADACAAFADAASPGDLVLRFVNQTAVDVYLPATCDSVDYRLEPAAGPDGDSYGDVFGFCSQSCEDLQTEGPIACEACLPTSYRIAPGAALEVTWSRLASHPTSMPPACWSDPQFGPACSQAVVAPDGAYALGITAYDGCMSDPVACACDAQTGLCEGFASGQSAEIAPVVFDLPTGGPVELVIEACTFGCPPQP